MYAKHILEGKGYKMQQHGEFRVWREGQILISQLRGAWNLETANSYFDTVCQLAEQIIDNPWARLVDLSEWEGSGEDVANVFVHMQHWAAKRNSRYVAYVKPHTLSLYMMEKYNTSDVIDYSIFDDQASALTFLNQCIADEK